MAHIDLGGGKAGAGGFVDRPEDRVALVDGGEPLGCGGEPLGHTQGKAEIDGQRETDTGSEQRPGQRIEDGGVDEAGVGR